MEKEHPEIQRKGGERWEDKESHITPAASISQFSSSTPSTKAAIPLQVFIPFQSTSKETDSHSLAICEFLLVITHGMMWRINTYCPVWDCGSHPALPSAEVQSRCPHPLVTPAEVGSLLKQGLALHCRHCSLHGHLSGRNGICIYSKEAPQQWMAVEDQQDLAIIISSYNIWKASPGRSMLHPTECTWAQHELLSDIFLSLLFLRILHVNSYIISPLPFYHALGGAFIRKGGKVFSLYRSSRTTWVTECSTLPRRENYWKLMNSWEAFNF